MGTEANSSRAGCCPGTTTLGINLESYTCSWASPFVPLGFLQPPSALQALHPDFAFSQMSYLEHNREGLMVQLHQQQLVLCQYR